MTLPVIRTEGLTRRLAGEIAITLVADVSLTVEPAEFIAITGPSGSGKSSLLYLLGLLDRPTGGRIWLNGLETSTLSEERLASIRLAQLGFVFQSHFLLPEFSARENVMLPMYQLDRLSHSAIEQRAQALLASFGLAGEGAKLPRQLSGGQSQRVAIARALANDPAIILADEPTGNLDTAASATVRQILRDLSRQHGRTVIVVTHDRDFAAAADRVVELVDGRMRIAKSLP